jgi:PTH1 family peptidyl-tRNA hydrolase
MGSAAVTRMAESRMVVGLGNPGQEYAQTRHNIGFWVVDALARTLGASMRQTKFGAKFDDVHFEGQKLILLKPWQFMNRSGRVVATAAGFYRLAPEDIWVVVDDLALEPGFLRVRSQGGAGGHNGLKDIIAQLGSDAFPRCRVGIGCGDVRDRVDYVLGRPSAEERTLLNETIVRAHDATLSWLRHGVERTMNDFNGSITPGETG